MFLLPSSRSDHLDLLAVCVQIHYGKALLSVIQLSHCLAKMTKPKSIQRDARDRKASNVLMIVSYLYV